MLKSFLLLATLQYLASLRICLTGTPKYIKPVYFIQVGNDSLVTVCFDPTS